MKIGIFSSQSFKSLEPQMTISFLPNLLLTSEYLNNLMLTGDFFSDLPWPEGCEGDKLFLEDFLDLASSFPG